MALTTNASTLMDESPLGKIIKRKSGEIFSTASLSTAADDNELNAAIIDYEADVTTDLVPLSDADFADPAQAMIILDWDDTLFPTTEFLDRWEVACPAEGEYVPEQPERIEQMQRWQEALRLFLERACALSDNCVIVTNSKRPWVTDCISRFAPELLQLFKRKHNSPRIVYAGEHTKRSGTFRSDIMRMKPLLYRAQELTSDEITSDLTAAKTAAMTKVVKKFYSRYPAQSWKNIVSIGDMPFERDALQELAFRRLPSGPERLRTKAVLEPAHPLLSELTLRLRVSTALLPAYVRFDGDINVDLQHAPEMASNILADALRLPGLRHLSISAHAWGCGPAPSHFDAEMSVEDLDFLVHSEFTP